MPIIAYKGLLMTSKRKGRTLWEILTGKNQRDLTPIELQYHNPLGAKVGNTITLDHEVDLRDINFVIEKMSVYETKVNGKKFFHTDYHLKGITLEMDRPLRFRLRLIPDEDAMNSLGCQVQLLHHYDEMEWDKDFHDMVLCSESCEFEVNYDDEGNELEHPRRYWRVENVFDPYNARVTILKDDDGDGTVEDEELERLDIRYWDYHRDTEDESNQEYREFLTVEMDAKTRYFTLLRGSFVDPTQIVVI